jgi:hypothetical protein
MIAQIDWNYMQVRPAKVVNRLLSYALFEGRPLTTRGQWINALVFAHFELEKRLPQMKKVEKPVFILGTGRSGTTVLGIVLSMHRDVGFLNEPKALWHAIYPHEDLIGSYSREPAQYRLAGEQVTSAVKANAHRLFGAYLTTVFSTRVVDKYPELIFRVPFVREIFPDAKFLFLVRNGWSTCASIEGWSNRLGQQVGAETHDWWGVDRRKWNLLVEQLVPAHPDLAPHEEALRSWTRQTDMAAVEWIVTMREGLRLLDEYPNEVMRVNYEELCQRPGEILEGITRFLELSTDDASFLKYGQQTLKSVVDKGPFPLDDAINLAFHETMRQLGYEERNEK